MNRREFISRAAAGAAVSSLHPAVAQQPAMPQASNRPNFLFMIADDLTFRVFESPLKHEIKTPHLDRLREEGCSFTHCFHQGSWSGAVVSPAARCSTLD